MKNFTANLRTVCSQNNFGTGRDIFSGFGTGRDFEFQKIRDSGSRKNSRGGTGFRVIQNPTYPYSLDTIIIKDFSRTKKVSIYRSLTLLFRAREHFSRVLHLFERMCLNISHRLSSLCSVIQGAEVK